MTTQNNETTNNTQTAARTAKMPTMVAKQRIGRGRQATYERIGVAWLNDDGSVYVKLHGTQLITGGFVLYPIGSDEPQNVAEGEVQKDAAEE